MNNKVLLTGVSGWIAKHTAIELLNSGYEVLGTVRNDGLICLLYTSPSPRDLSTSRMPSSA